jgi:hypothetical protein
MRHFCSRVISLSSEFYIFPYRNIKITMHRCTRIIVSDVYGLLCYNVVCFRGSRTFGRNLSPTASGSKKKTPTKTIDKATFRFRKRRYHVFQKLGLPPNFRALQLHTRKSPLQEIQFQYTCWFLCGFEASSHSKR